jgi:glucose-1-phosphate cytidylyltransferase
MKAVFFAGGLGTRLSEETAVRPKPMVDVAGKPIIWHIMKRYAAFGIRDFIVLGGYRVEFIRDYFLNYRMMSSDFTIDLATGEILWSANKGEDWRVTVLDTGLDTMTGGRLKRAKDMIGNETFCLTYGDGVSDVDLDALVAFHKAQGTWATVTATEPPGRFGVMNFSQDGTRVEAFREKSGSDVGLINAGFFVCEPQVFDLIEDDTTVWEQAPMRRLVELGQLSSYRHEGFWQSMDTLRDKQVLEEAYLNGAPWLKKTTK